MKIYTTTGAFYSSSDMDRVYKDFPKEKWEYRYRNGNLYIVPSVIGEESMKENLTLLSPRVYKHKDYTEE